jgi:bifunctional non-homologous end joining protein LigD
MPLGRRAEPFDHPEWIFELKYDGFRALAHIKSVRCQLISRNRNPFASQTADAVSYARRGMEKCLAIA